MESTHSTALLILIGGRQVPNVLTARFLRPTHIVPIASADAMRPDEAWSHVEPVLRQLCPDGLTDPLVVDANDPRQTQEACVSVVAAHPGVEWVFNLTCGTKPMSFGAYEVAKTAGASAWYLDTANSRVVTLCGTPPSGNPFHMSVAEYMGTHGRQMEPVRTPPEREEVQLATDLARRPVQTLRFREILRRAQVNEISNQSSREVTLRSEARWFPELFTLAASAGLLTNLRMQHGLAVCEIKGTALWRFFDGLWLEVLAWSIAKTIPEIDDARMNIAIPGETGRNEVDLALTRAASLLIAECKTEGDAFGKPETLSKLDSVAGLLGGKYVRRLVICSQIKPDKANPAYASYLSFQDQAAARQIVVVTGEQLTGLKAILTKETGPTPTYSPL